ncbi:MAG: hypothetical protein K0Q59_1788 [Paenibacillus sp.]|jgi:hypothetical protein|nr:hypothetical protein [Paenibacillus sp.]
MLEAETTKRVNELIRGMCRFCINSFEKGNTVHTDDLNALAALITSVNSCGNGGPSPAIGFTAQSDHETEARKR